jgi:hypothetical protein
VIRILDYYVFWFWIGLGVWAILSSLMRKGDHLRRLLFWCWVGIGVWQVLKLVER